MQVGTCSSSGETNCINTVSGNKSFYVGGRDVCRLEPISATIIELLLPETVLIQFVSPDDEHCVLETCREL